MKMKTHTNRHPADALADVREEIKAWQQREEILRQELIVSDDRIGTEWEASIHSRAQERLDSGAVIEHFGTATLRPFFRRIEFKQVRLKRHGD
jgi:hypothetical protein